MAEIFLTGEEELSSKKMYQYDTYLLIWLING